MGVVGRPGTPTASARGGGPGTSCLDRPGLGGWQARPDPPGPTPDPVTWGC